LLLLTRSLGRNTLVRTSWALPWPKELRSILLQTVGVLGRLGAALTPLEGTEDASVYESWAARFTGEVGSSPREIDVVVIGNVNLRAR
jgi:hypothetical protein